MLPFFGGTGTDNAKMYLRIAFSAIVAFFSVLFVTPQEIYDSLAGYGAMAVVLTAIIPFMIILAIYAKLATDPDAWKILIAKTLGIAFVVYLIYRLVILWALSPKDAWSGALFVTALMLGIMIALISCDERLRHYFLKWKMKGYLAEADLTNKKEIEAQVIRLRAEAADLAKNGDNAGAFRLNQNAANLEIYVAHMDNLL